MEWGHAATLFLTQTLAYLAGSVPFGYLVARAVAGIDIRLHGSGNIGATNVGRVLGLKWFLAVFALDFAKGALPVAAAWLVQRQSHPADAEVPAGMLYLPEAAGFAAIMGHLFPAFLGGKGGKGVATSIGVMALLAPSATLAGLLAFVALFLPTRMVSVGSLAFAAGLAARHFGFDHRADAWSTPLFAKSCFIVAAAGLVVARHLGNIRRILAGTESRVPLPWARRPAAAPAAESSPSAAPPQG